MLSISGVFHVVRQAGKRKLNPFFFGSEEANQMKIINFTLLLLLIIVFGIPLLATANPYVGADITLNGNNYSSISTPSDPCVCEPQNSCVWFETDSVIYTAWSDKCIWVELESL